MAGILNNKERIMDFTITDEGKRQAGQGQMRIKFATFTDYHTFYDVSGSNEFPNLASDASSRVFFETYNRYQDVIVPEIEAGMSMRPFKTKDLEVAGGALAAGSAFTGITNHPEIVSDVPEKIVDLLDGITQNFAEQRIITSIDEFSKFQDLILAPLTGTFNLTPSTDFFRADNETGQAMLESIPSIFQDRRFAHFPNFMFLPPENLPLPGESSGFVLGNYPAFGESQIMSEDEINESLAEKDFTEISFVETSRRNNIAIQFFEASPGNIDKLSVVDFGEFEDEDPLSPGRRVLFVGKMLRDGNASETFCNIFTVVID